MSANTTKSTTPADVSAKAVEDNLVTSSVPTQSKTSTSGEKKVQAENSDDVQGDENTTDKVKKTLKARAKDMTEKVANNKNVLGGFLLGTAVGAVSYARFVASKAALLDSDTTDEVVVDESADQPTV